MQDAREEVIVGIGAADVNDAGARQILRQQVHHAIARILVERIEHLVDQQPRRRVQQASRERHRLLLVLAQLPIPAP
jgi:hypothetical protein